MNRIAHMLVGLQMCPVLVRYKKMGTHMKTLLYSAPSGQNRHKAPVVEVALLGYETLWKTLNFFKQMLID